MQTGLFVSKKHAYLGVFPFKFDQEAVGIYGRGHAKSN